MNCLPIAAIVIGVVMVFWLAWLAHFILWIRKRLQQHDEEMDAVIDAHFKDMDRMIDNKRRGYPLNYEP